MVMRPRQGLGSVSWSKSGVLALSQEVVRTQSVQAPVLPYPFSYPCKQLLAHCLRSLPRRPEKGKSWLPGLGPALLEMGLET
jgi:hypothetical protein